MFAITIICSAEVTLETIKQLSAPDIVFEDSDPISICIGNEDDIYLAVTDVDSDAAEIKVDDPEADYDCIDFYQGEQKTEILRHFDPAKVFLVQFVGFDLLKEFLDKISSLNIFIDNDQGKLLTAYHLLSYKKYEDFINSFTASP